MNLPKQHAFPSTGVAFYWAMEYPWLVDDMYQQFLTLLKGAPAATTLQVE